MATWVEKITHIFGEGGDRPDAIRMLKDDHKKVKGLFEEFEKAEQGSAKRRIVRATIGELRVHAEIEEEILYPALRKALAEEGKVDEAEEEHHVMKLLLAELEKMRPGGERYDAKYTVLSESVKHHIEEEESDIFPEAESKIDNAGLGARMAERKAELMGRAGAAPARRRKKPAEPRARKSAPDGRAAARRR